MVKIILLVSYMVYVVYSFVIDLIDYLAYKRPIPDKVSDIYDEQTYLKWKKYKKENAICSMIFNLFEFMVTFVLLVFDVFAIVESIANGNVYNQALVVVAFFLLYSFIISVIKEYVSIMIIEEKYGFNKTTLSRFIVDQVRSLIITGGLTIGLLMLFVFLYTLIGYYIILAFIGIILLILLIVVALYPFLSKLSNKYVELEDGELKTKLIELLNKYGFTVRRIEVMKASERTTKLNASFSGLGKTKTIVLYDNLIELLTPDEICAVFAHELGHGLHKDNIKTFPFTIFMVALFVLSICAIVSFDELYLAFAFDNINYGFAYVILLSFVLPYVVTFTNLLSSFISRRNEFNADEQAVIEGYGEDLIFALKKLALHNYAELNPSKIIVALTYSHPPILQRIVNIEDKMKK